MTPKDKAQELVEKFMPLCTYNRDGLVIPVAKQAAIICVDEIIANWEEEAYPHFHYGKIKNYWQSVKAEIENL